LVKFREQMIAHDLDRKLVDRTVALAKQRSGWQAVRAALDSSPLLGAGRVPLTSQADEGKCAHD
jgi:transposase